MRIDPDVAREDLKRIDELMRQGIQRDAVTGKEYFTGYSYNTLYDWDQYFEAIVQRYLDWDLQYIRNGVTIFLDNQYEDGFITRCIPTGSSDEKTEHVKPFLAQISILLYQWEGSLNWLNEIYYARMKKYLLYWLDRKDPNGNGLSTWDSGPHSGMDDQIERVGPWKSCFCEGVDLNSFLYRECTAFSKLAGIKGKLDDEDYFMKRASVLKDNICNHLWCEEDGFFYDRDERTGEFIRVKSSSGFSPLWAGIASREQAEILVSRHLLNPAEFWRAFPVPSYAATEPGYREEHMEQDVGCNWRAQTWIPVNYYIMHGLMKYGYHETARELAWKTYENVKKIGDREYYSTDSQTGRGLDPFWGWSLLAYFMPSEIETGYDPTDLSEGIWELKLKL